MCKNSSTGVMAFYQSFSVLTCVKSGSTGGLQRFILEVSAPQRTHESCGDVAHLGVEQHSLLQEISLSICVYRLL